VTPYRSSSDRWSLLRICGWGLTWAFGTGLGVALGAYLTVTSGAGAPGGEAVGTVREFLTLPAIAALGVFAVYVVGALLARLVGGRLAHRPAADDNEEDHGSGDDGVKRQLGREVEASKD